MSNSFEKSVKGATKIKLAPPKAKYVDHILLATRSGDAGVAEVFRTLQLRIRDSTWTIVFKALIMVHLMIRNGQPDVTLAYLAQAPKSRLATSEFTAVQVQGDNIQRYAKYLMARAVGYANTKTDYVREGAVNRMKSLTIEKGLLMETRAIHDQMRALLRCNTIAHEQNNSIVTAACMSLYNDLLSLYATMNQAVMTVLTHFFELSNVDAKQAVTIYKIFVRQTEQVIDFLADARESGQITTRSVPNIKPANAQILPKLEAHVGADDFEAIRQQHLRDKSGSQRFPTKTPTTPANTSAHSGAQTAPAVSNTTNPANVRNSAPPADLIDFFDSIEQTNQQPTYLSQPVFQASQYEQQPQNYAMQAQMQMQQPQYIQTQPTQNYAAQSNQPMQTGNPFVPTPLPLVQIPQAMSYVQQQMPQMTGQPQLVPQMTSPTTNPFRQSMMMTGQPVFDNPQAMSGNFGMAPNNGPSLTIQPQMTGTNPFAKQSPSQANGVSPQGLQPMVTGSTNPFRQSRFIDQQTGRGWQTGMQQGTMGGLEQMQTVPVFPRPGQ